MTPQKMSSKNLQQTLYLRMKYQKRFLTIKNNSRIFHYYHLYFTQSFSQHKKTRGEYKTCKEQKGRNNLTINCRQYIVYVCICLLFLDNKLLQIQQLQTAHIYYLTVLSVRTLFSAQGRRRQKSKWGSASVLSWITGSFFKLTSLLAGFSSL